MNLPSVSNAGPEDTEENNRNDNASAYCFDLKLKFDSVPEWDGNTDTIVRWLSKINDLAKTSPTIFKQLGSVVPKRLKGSAETWYYSLPLNYRNEAEQTWETLRLIISDYYMNRKWFDNMKKRANNARYRETGYSHETPSEYFIQKNDLLTTVYENDDSLLISEIMSGAPTIWETILTTQVYQTTVELQSAIKFHEETLMSL
ncbi:hypothetical protein DFJ43DRAFT_1009055, partial [Lentinula guzmanii]